MRNLLSLALFLVLGAGMSAPLMAQDGQQKEAEKKEVEAVKPTTYKAVVAGMT